MRQSNMLANILDNYKDLSKLIPKVAIIESSPTEPYAIIEGQKTLVFCSNNYLGLANSQVVKEASIQAINKYGYGSGGSRWASGTTDLHQELDKKLARFKGKQAAVTFSAGFMANYGVISALINSVTGNIRNTIVPAIFSDELNHASIIAGCINSQAKIYVYEHKNMVHLSDLLEKSKETYKLIVTDGVFSMDGDIAPLDEIVKLARKYSAMIMVDEAHAVGILGKNGKGTAEHFGVEDDIEIIMGTLSKTFGSLGGYIACDTVLAEYIRCSAKSYIFSASMPPINAAAVMAVLDEITSNLTYQKKVLDMAQYLRSNLNKLGLDTLSSETAIIPIYIGDETKAINIAKELMDDGIYLTCAIWPAVGKGQARLRATVTAGHEKKHIDDFLEILKKHKDKF